MYSALTYKWMSCAHRYSCMYSAYNITVCSVHTVITEVTVHKELYVQRTHI